MNQKILNITDKIKNKEEKTYLYLDGMENGLKICFDYEGQSAYDDCTLDTLIEWKDIDMFIQEIKRLRTIYNN